MMVYGMKKYIAGILSFLWIHIESVIALVIAVAAGVLGLRKAIDTSQMLGCLLVTLSMLAGGQIKASIVQNKLMVVLKDLLFRIDTPSTADNVFTKKTDEGSIIKTADKELWVVQETGNKLTEDTAQEIISFLKSGGVLRVVLATPTESAARLLSLRNEHLTHEEIIKRANLARAHIREMLDSAGPEAAERMTVRYLPYPMGWTLVVADPEHQEISKRKVVARSSGFKVNYANKYDLLLSGERDPKLLRHFYDEAKNQYLYASKCMLLIGDPRSGKTTFLKSLVASKHQEKNIYYVYCPEILKNGERTGFEYITSESLDPVVFAVRNSEGGYDRVPGVWEPVINGLKRAASEGHIIVFDEIGPLQLAESSLRDTIMQIVDDPTATIFATIADPVSGGIDAEDDIRRILCSPRTDVHRLSRNQNNEALKEVFQKELKASIKQAGILEHVMRN